MRRSRLAVILLSGLLMAGPVVAQESAERLADVALPAALDRVLRDYEQAWRTGDAKALAGLGDLVLTCTGDLSRNRRLGLALGRGQTLQDAIREIGQVVESVQTADEVMRQARRHGIDLPISDRVRAVLHGEQTPEEGLRALLAREQKPEYPDTLFK